MNNNPASNRRFSGGNPPASSRRLSGGATPTHASGRRNSANVSSDDEGDYVGEGGVGGVVGSAGKSIRRGMNNLSSIAIRGRSAGSDDEGGGGPAIVGASIALTRGAAGAVFSTVRRGANVVAGAARVVVGNEGVGGAGHDRGSRRGSMTNDRTKSLSSVDASKSSHQTRRPTKAEEEEDPADEYDRHKINDIGPSGRSKIENLEPGIEQKPSKTEDRRKSKANEAFARRRGGAGTSADRVRSTDLIGGHDANILDTLPLEYRYNPRTATPV